MEKLADKLKDTKLVPMNPKNDLQSVLKNNWQRIAAVAPKHLNAERLYQIAVSTINTTPKLAECSPVSVLSCLMTCSALGLEPSAVDGLGRAYIIPRRNSKTNQQEATFLLGYKGMIDLARRSEQIKSIEAHVVHEGDEFTYSYGLHPDLIHIPKGLSDNITHAYMVAHFTNGGYHFEVMTLAEIQAIRERSQAASSSFSPWSTDFPAMACKTVIRKAFKYLPVSTEAMQASEADETSGMYEAIIDAKPLIEEETGEIIESVDNDEAEQK